MYRLAALIGFATGTALVLWVFLRELSTPASPAALFQATLDANGGVCPCHHCASYRWRVEQDMLEYDRKRAELGLA